MVRCPGEKFEVPDYRIYKIEDIPELMVIQKRLENLGLKDPWLRNEVWRYDRNEFSTERKRLRTLVFRGFKVGFIAFMATVVGEYLMNKNKERRRVVVDPCPPRSPPS